MKIYVELSMKNEKKVYDFGAGCKKPLSKVFNRVTLVSAHRVSPQRNFSGEKVKNNYLRCHLAPQVHGTSFVLYSWKMPNLSLHITVVKYFLIQTDLKTNRKRLLSLVEINFLWFSLLVLTLPIKILKICLSHEDKNWGDLSLSPCSRNNIYCNCDVRLSKCIAYHLSYRD